MGTGWYWFFGLLWAYILLIFWLIKSGKMQEWGMSLAFGFVLMIRTQRGKGLLEIVSKPKRLWNLFADIGIWVTLLVMAAFTFLLALTIGPSLSPDSGLQAAPANQILVIPGVNPIVPLWYGLIGLIVTLVVHEGGHGVLARANQLKVKSLGLLFAIVPVGAFVEPDEDEIREATLRQRLRVFCAGPMVNITVGMLLLIPMIAMAGAAAATDGAALQNVVDDGPADLAGIGPGDIIVAINDTTVLRADTLGDALEPYRPGDNVTVHLADGSQHQMQLANRWDLMDDEAREAIADFDEDTQAFCEARYGENASKEWGACAEALQNDPMVGVGLFDSHQWHSVLAQPFGDRGVNLLRLIGLPLGEVQGSPVLSTYLPTFIETPFQSDAFWIIYNILFWSFWLNVLVGTFNALPMLPLDGGHIFRDAMAGFLQKLRPNMARDNRDRIVGRVAGWVSLGIFAIILISLIGPRISGLWG